MFPFDFRHGEQRLRKFTTTAVSSVSGSHFVFPHVPALEFARSIHWCEPAGNMAQESGSSADDYRLEFLPGAWAFSQIPKHFTHKLAVMPFFLLDGSDSISFFGILN